MCATGITAILFLLNQPNTVIFPLMDGLLKAIIRNATIVWLKYTVQCSGPQILRCLITNFREYLRVKVIGCCNILGLCRRRNLSPVFERLRNSADDLVLGPQRTQRFTGSAFRIFLQPDWQIDNGFF